MAKSMAKTLLAALAAGAILSSLPLGSRAAAMPLTAPRAFGAATAPMFTRAANVCGLNGCAPIFVKRVRKPPANFVRRAAPLVFPRANPTQKAAANN